MTNSQDWGKPAVNPWPTTSNTGPLSQPAALAAVVAAKPSIPAHIVAELSKRTLSNDKDGLLQLWQATKTELESAKAFEMEIRKLCVSIIVPEEIKHEGMNNVELGNGYIAKATIKYNYSLKAPPDSKKNVVDEVDDCIDDFAKIDNEGAFIAERLFTWQAPSFSVAEYRKLCEEAETSATKKALLTRLNRVLNISEAAPTLEIKEPKTPGKGKR